MGKIDFNELESVPEKVASTAKMVASNAAHLLHAAPYPGKG
jgi:hypothetical protein